MVKTLYKSALTATAAGAALGLVALVGATPALAATTISGDAFYVATFAGQDCPVKGADGFSSCWATTSGVVGSRPTDPTASPVVAKFDAGGAFEKNGIFTTFTQSDVTISRSGNTLSFTYNMGAGDPMLRYITIKQAQDYALFYNSTGFASGTTYTFNLARFDQVGWSHLTVYDSVGTAVPEPGTWAMMLLGFGAIGATMRRRRRVGALLQMA